MDKVYQVFVSSTFEDLKEERQQVSNNLAKAGYVVAGMELFPATDKQQLEYIKRIIKRIIDRSDYYVVIVAGRYGSVGGDNVSFTEAEFEYAKSKAFLSWRSFMPILRKSLLEGLMKTPRRPRSLRGSGRNYRAIGSLNFGMMPVTFAPRSLSRSQTL